MFSESFNKEISKYQSQKKFLEKYSNHIFTPYINISKNERAI